MDVFFHGFYVNFFLGLIIITHMHQYALRKTRAMHLHTSSNIKSNNSNISSNNTVWSFYNLILALLLCLRFSFFSLFWSLLTN